MTSHLRAAAAVAAIGVAASSALTSTPSFAATVRTKAPGIPAPLGPHAHAAERRRRGRRAARLPHGHRCLGRRHRLTQSGATVSCPANTVVLDGGATSTSTGSEVSITSAWPVSTTQFRGFIANNSGFDETLTVFAICGHRPPVYAIVPTVHEAAALANSDGGSTCSAKTVLLGGGTRVDSPSPSIGISTMVDDGPTAWTDEVANSLPEALGFTSFAICGA